MTQGTAAVSALRDRRPGEVQVARALLSVSDKTGIVEFARGLADLGIEIVSTGGTAHELAEAGIPGPLDLRPHRFSGDHGRAGQDASPQALRRACWRCATTAAHIGRRAGARRRVRRPGVREPVSVRAHAPTRAACTESEVIENIDIGGPTMIRAAAKNSDFVAPVVSPESYDAVLAELREADRRLSPATREFLAAEAFAYTARYDTAIARWFQEKREDFPPLMVRAFERVLELPYGENPHQRAAYYAQVGARTHVLSMVAQLGGKPLSYNNLLDLDSGAAAAGRVPDSRVRDRQAQQPLWGRGRQPPPLEAYRARVRVRPDVGLRRRDLPEPRRRPRAGRALLVASSSRCCSPRATTTTRSRCCPRSQTCGCSTTASAAPRT